MCGEDIVMLLVGQVWGRERRKDREWDHVVTVCGVYGRVVVF